MGFNTPIKMLKSIKDYHVSPCQWGLFNNLQNKNFLIVIYQREVMNITKTKNKTVEWLKN